MDDTDLTQDLHDFKSRAAPGRKHNLARHVYLESLELFLAHIALGLCALNILQNLLYTQPASSNWIRVGSRSRCEGVYARAANHAPRIFRHCSLFLQL
jgi:hypothetical protein